MKKIQDCIIVGIFAVFLAAGLLGGLLTEDRDFSPDENRMLQQLPELSAASVFSGDFSEAFQEYENDQFPMRDGWTAMAASVRLAEGRKDINGVYIGKDGYLIERILPEDVDGDQLQKNLSAIENFRETLPADIDMSVMIVPTSGCMLAEKLPENAPYFDERSVSDQACRALERCGWVDLYSAFEGRSEQLYYRTDHHWTMKGAELAFRTWKPEAELTRERYPLSRDFQGTMYSRVLWDSGVRDTVEGYGRGPEQYDISAEGEPLEGGMYQMDKLEEKDKYAVYLGGNYGRLELDTGTEREGNLLIIKDSFANCLVPYAAEYFGRVCLVDLRYFSGNLQEYMEENKITEVLVLYSMSNLIRDRNIEMIDSRGNILS
ncbi:MAG: DHHW family protein [Emergencia sp.]